MALLSRKQVLSLLKKNEETYYDGVASSCIVLYEDGSDSGTEYTRRECAAAVFVPSDLKLKFPPVAIGCYVAPAKDSTKSAYKFLYTWLIEQSPWKDCFLSTVKDALKYGVTVVDANFPCNVLIGALMVARIPLEFFAFLRSFEFFRNSGLNGHQAAVAMYNFCQEGKEVESANSNHFPITLKGGDVANREGLRYFLQGRLPPNSALYSRHFYKTITRDKGVQAIFSSREGRCLNLEDVARHPLVVDTVVSEQRGGWGRQIAVTPKPDWIKGLKTVLRSIERG